MLPNFLPKSTSSLPIVFPKSSNSSPPDQPTNPFPTLLKKSSIVFQPPQFAKGLPFMFKEISYFLPSFPACYHVTEFHKGLCTFFQKVQNSHFKRRLAFVFSALFCICLAPDKGWCYILPYQLSAYPYRAVLLASRRKWWVQDFF